MRPTPMAFVFLLTPPVMWACNAVLGRMLAQQVSPMTLNLFRWLLAFLILLPLAGRVLRRNSPLWPQWRRFAYLSLFSIGGYNALLYLSLNTSSAINVTLVGASTPIWMMVFGRVLFGVPISGRQVMGALLSVAGVALVLGRGEWQILMQFRLVPGDFYVLAASMAWAYYSWLLAFPTAESASIRADWASFLMAQVAIGIGWSALFAGGEWLLTPAHIDWSWSLLAAMVFIAIGPAVLAYGAYGAGVARAGPTMAGLFVNLTPLIAAVLSSAFLGEPPQMHHLGAFVLIVSGILLASRRR